MFCVLAGLAIRSVSHHLALLGFRERHLKEDWQEIGTKKKEHEYGKSVTVS